MKARKLFEGMQMLGIIKKIFGTAQGRLIERYKKIVRQVNAIDQEWIHLSDDELRAKTGEFRERIARGESLDDLLPEAYAAVKNACRRLCGTDVHVSGYDQKWDMVPYDMQILAGIAMHHGSIAEIHTGVGLTVTASMPLYLNALTGKPVHLITVNDYLAQRDCQWVGAIFHWFGMRAEPLVNSTPTQMRKQVYLADVVYGTAAEFGFDYLRDNSMAQSAREQCQRGYYFVIIDEIDSILIDEARTPLIISGPSSESRQMYDQLKDPVFEIVKLQKDFCNKLAASSKKILDSSFDKGSKKEEEQAFKQLWVVSKGMPQNKVIKKCKEDPDLRSALDQWDIYFYAEPNKEERAEMLSQLFIIIDEKSSDYELTDKGIHAWMDKGNEEDFIMLDLGYEYAKIDQHTQWTEQEKIEKKMALREEDARKKERSHNLRQLFRAHLLMEKDIDYIIDDEKIVIIDEHTGRPQPGRRFSDGLHQAIEAKEGLEIQGETQTLATVTLQNYFRLYEKLAGMTGTAMTEANEFKEIYKLDVLEIPTHQPCKRVDFDDQVYMTEREKYNAILKEIQEIHANGRPILIGTESVGESEKLSRILKQNKLEHTVLNAKNHAKEAEIIADAGKEGAITVSTNMAGRGTDIKLKPGVKELGGLHVIGTTRHQSRRIDRQLRGRCARQGDPGASKFYVSFEDTLMRLFSSPRVTLFLQKFRPPEGEAISAKILNKSIETAQKRIEQRNYMIRKHTLEYDDVMNKQREEIYAFRNETLRGNDPITLAKEILESLCSHITREFTSRKDEEHQWNIEGYCAALMSFFPITFDYDTFANDLLSTGEIEQITIDKVLSHFSSKLQHDVSSIALIQEDLPSTMPKTDPQEILHQVIRSILIRKIDQYWQQHLLHIDHLRTEVSLRVVGQKDPLLEFKHEAFALFDELSLKIKQEIAKSMFKFAMATPKKQVVEPKPIRKPLAPFRLSLASIPDLEKSH